MIGEILEKIESSGINGIKKAELKKAYGKDSENILERLREKEQIFVERKGTAYFVWTRENYIHYITENDPKFKLILTMSAGLSYSLAKIQSHVDTLQGELNRSQENYSQDKEFEQIFNRSLNESATSIGWTPFVKIREKICETQSLSKEKFYQMVMKLIERNQERYEISSGGQEGIMMRGLIHGYVRNV